MVHDTKRIRSCLSDFRVTVYHELIRVVSRNPRYRMYRYVEQEGRQEGSVLYLGRRRKDRKEVYCTWVGGGRTGSREVKLDVCFYDKAYARGSE